MLRNFLIGLISFAVILSLFVFTENEVAPHFQTCVSQDTADQGNETAENKAPFIVGVIKAQAICSLGLVDRHNGFFAALAGIAVAAFTFTLWVATDKLWRAGEKQFRQAQASSLRQDLRTQEQLRLAREEFISTHRPIVRVRLVTVSAFGARFGIDNFSHGDEVEIERGISTNTRPRLRVRRLECRPIGRAE
jgi:hypothetical protein